MSNNSKEFKKYRMKQLIDFSSRSGNKRNYCKCWKGVSKEHFITMCEIVHKLVNQGYECYTESTFINKSRADIFAISPSGDGYAIEILHTETDKMFKLKEETYPNELILIKVKSKDFNINKWDL